MFNVNPAQFESFAKEAKLTQSEMKSMIFQRDLRPRKNLTIFPLADKDTHPRKSTAPKRVAHKNHSLRHTHHKDEKDIGVKNLFKEHQEKEVETFFLNHLEKLQKCCFILQPQQENEFKVYVNFLQLNPSDKRIQHFLFQLYIEVGKRGGIVQITSRNRFKQIITHFNTLLQPTQPISAETLFFVYKKYILAYEFYKRKLPHQNVEMDLIRFLSYQEFKKQRQLHLDTLVDIDIMVIENFQGHLDRLESKFTAEFLNNSYGNDIIQTRLQHPTVLGFKVNSEMMYNGVVKMPLKDYFQYQAVFDQPEQLSKVNAFKSLKKDFIFFAVNIDLQDKLEIDTQIKKLIEQIPMIRYLDDCDGLSYAENMIPGCNFPQIYVKVKGSWTGGHQENLGLCSVNINHGPDESQWITLDARYMPLLRKEIKKQFGVDIHEAQGLWFQKVQWFMARGYPVKRLIQKKGDLVYSGAGTLHWVRSFGRCIQSAWNIFPKTLHQLNVARNRQLINQQIRFRYTVIPLKSLLVKIMNHESHKSNEFMKQCERLVKLWIQQEQDIFMADYFTQTSSTLRKLQDIHSFCRICKKEIMNYYFIIKQKVVCLRCIPDQKKGEKVKEIFHKYDPKNLLDLQLFNTLEHSSPTYLPHCLIQNLCAGNMVGQIKSCTIKAKNNSILSNMANNIQSTLAKQNFEARDALFIFESLKKTYPFLKATSKNKLLDTIREAYNNHMPLQTLPSEETMMIMQPKQRQRSRSRSKSKQKYHTLTKLHQKLSLQDKKQQQLPHLISKNSQFITSTPQSEIPPTSSNNPMAKQYINTNDNHHSYPDNNSLLYQKKIQIEYRSEVTFTKSHQKINVVSNKIVDDNREHEFQQSIRNLHNLDKGKRDVSSSRLFEKSDEKLFNDKRDFRGEGRNRGDNRRDYRRDDRRDAQRGNNTYNKRDGGNGNHHQKEQYENYKRDRGDYNYKNEGNGTYGEDGGDNNFKNKYYDRNDNFNKKSSHRGGTYDYDNYEDNRKRTYKEDDFSRKDEGDRRDNYYNKSGGYYPKDRDNKDNYNSKNYQNNGYSYNNSSNNSYNSSNETKSYSNNNNNNGDNNTYSNGGVYQNSSYNSNKDKDKNTSYNYSRSGNYTNNNNTNSSFKNNNDDYNMNSSSYNNNTNGYQKQSGHNNTNSSSYSNNNYQCGNNNSSWNQSSITTLSNYEHTNFEHRGSTTIIESSSTRRNDFNNGTKNDYDDDYNNNHARNSSNGNKNSENYGKYNNGSYKSNSNNYSKRDNNTYPEESNKGVYPSNSYNYNNNYNRNKQKKDEQKQQYLQKQSKTIAATSLSNMEIEY